MAKDQYREIHCCGCKCDVNARLTRGEEVYPHRSDLRGIPFWKCDTCGNWVGTHYKTDDWTRPLGSIPNPEMKKARQHIHQALEPIWKSNRMKRSVVYERIAKSLNVEKYHTAELRTIEDARAAYRAVIDLRRELGMGA